MSNLEVFRSPAKKIIMIFLLGLLTACGGGSSEMSNNVNPGAGNENQVMISGSVGDGPITGATITVKAADGTILATAISDITAGYEVAVPDQATYPYTIIATSGTDMVTGTTPDFTMVSIVTGPDDVIANINPFSTLIVKTAQAMPGGLSTTNMDIASQTIVQHLNFGLDTAVVSNPITTPITSQNVANIVKASEVLGEMIRRTHSALLTAGNNITEDEIISTLAADMTDGLMNGQGNGDEIGVASPLIAATANIVSGQVLVEALSNNLNVNGAWATDLLDNAIRLTLPESTTSTSDVTITEAMLDQVKTSINAAQTHNPSSNLTALSQIIDTLTPGSRAIDIEDVLPIENSNYFNDAIVDVVLLNEDQLDEINTTTPGSGSVVIPQAGWNLLFVDSQETVGEDGTATNAFDADPATFWHTQWQGGNPIPPHEIWIDLGAVYNLDGFHYLPRQDGGTNGRINNYQFYVSNDTSNWGTAVATGAFANNALEKEVTFPVKAGQFIRLVAVNSINGQAWTSAAEINVLGTLAAPGNIIAPVISFTANPLEIAYNGTSTLTWMSNNAVSCSAVGGWSSTHTTSGSVTVGPLTTNSSYTLNCINSESMMTSSTVTISVSQPQPQNSIPVAVDDAADTNQSTSVTVNVLGNDLNLNDSPVTVSLFNGPTNGTATVQSNNTISYIPNTGYSGADSFIYRIMDSNGDSATALVTLNIICTTCVSTPDSTITLKWNPNPDDITGYIVYYGYTANTATQEITDIPIDSAGFDKLVPSVDYQSWSDLGVLRGDTICFTIRAYNNIGLSAWPTAQCSTL